MEEKKMKDHTAKSYLISNGNGGGEGIEDIRGDGRRRRGKGRGGEEFTYPRGFWVMWWWWRGGGRGARR